MSDVKSYYLREDCPGGAWMAENTFDERREELYVRKEDYDRLRAFSMSLANMLGFASELPQPTTLSINRDCGKNLNAVVAALDEVLRLRAERDGLMSNIATITDAYNVACEERDHLKKQIEKQLQRGAS